MKNDPRSCECNYLCNCVRSLKKKIHDFNRIWTRDVAIPVRCSNQLSYEATDVGSWSIMCLYVPVKEMNVTNEYQINHIRTAERKANEEWLPPCICERNLCFTQLRKNVFSMMVDFSKLTLTRKISFPFKPLVNLPTMADVVVWKQ